MDTIVGIRMSKELKKAVEKLALQDRRKLSDYIRVQLENLVEQSKTRK